MRVHPTALTLLLALTFAVPAAIAEEHSHQHGDAGFERMQELENQAHNTADPSERQAFMQEHMKVMHEKMRSMHSMMNDETQSGGDMQANMGQMHEHMKTMMQMMEGMMAQQEMMMQMPVDHPAEH